MNFKFLAIILIAFNLLHSEPAIWKVNEKDIYLMGSIHIANSELYPLPSQYDSLAGNVQFLGVEADISSPTIMKLVAKTVMEKMAQNPIYLQNLITSEDSVTLAEISAELGIAPQMLLMTPPWVASMQLTQMYLEKQGNDPALGIDMHFINMAKKNKTEIIGIESPILAINTLADLDSSTQYFLFKQTINDIKNDEIKFNEMLEAYKTGNTGYLIKLLHEEQYSVEELKPLMEKLLYERNERMSESIADLIKEKKSGLIVVGAAHLVGERKIQDYLKKLGYETTRVYFDQKGQAE